MTGFVHAEVIKGGKITGSAAHAGAKTEATRDPDVRSFLARMETPPSAEVQAAIATFVARLKQGGAWDVWQQMHILALPDAQAARLNLISPKGTLVEVGTPVFTPGIGYSGAEDAYLRGPAIADMAKFQPDDATVVFWNLDGGKRSNLPDAAGGGPDGFRIVARDSGSTMRFVSGTPRPAMLPARTSNAGLIGFSRASAETFSTIYDTQMTEFPLPAAAARSSATGDDAFVRIARSPRRVAFFAMGRHITQEQLDVLNDALIDLLAALGAIPAATWNTSFSGRDLPDLAGAPVVFEDEFDTRDIGADDPMKPRVLPVEGYRWYAPARGTVGSGKHQLPGTPGIYEQSGSELTLSCRYDGKQWLSAHMQTMSSLGFGTAIPRGYFEARIRMPPNPTGSWPAFWMKTENSIRERTSEYAEIDVMELYSADPIRYGPAWHRWRMAGPKKHRAGPLRLYGNRTTLFDNEFHLYGAEITEDSAIIYLDRKEIGRFKLFPSAKSGPYYMNLSHQCDNKPNNPQETDKPLDMIVDYVRVWER